MHLPSFTGWALNGSTPAAPWQAIQQRWKSCVPHESLVLMPGDLCHHTDLSKAQEGYRHLDRLPGRHKVMVPGNHDWPTASEPKQFRQVAQGETLNPLLGGAIRLTFAGLDRGLVLAGTCGAWPTMNGSGIHRPCYKREVRRLESALQRAEELYQPGDGMIALLHYPPFSQQRRPTRLTGLLGESRVQLAVFGHVHNRQRWPRVFQGEYGGVCYRFLAADYLNLTPRRLGGFGPKGLHLD